MSRISVSSSNVRSIGYDEWSATLEVQFVLVVSTSITTCPTTFMPHSCRRDRKVASTTVACAIAIVAIVWGDDAMTYDRDTQTLLAQHIRELLAEVASFKEAGAEVLTETLAQWLTAHYVVAAKSAAKKASAEGIDLKTLRALSSDVVALRRGDQYAERLRIEREQLELDREQSKERREKLFWEWATKPENKSLICDRGLSAEEKAKRLRQIFGVTSSPNTEGSGGGLSANALQAIEEAAKLL